MGRGRTKGAPRSNRVARGSVAADPGREISRLRQELEQAQRLLQQVEQNSTEAGSLVLTRRLAALEEERQVARGQAVDAVMDRSRAEAELKRLRDAIQKAPGWQGWLLRRAVRKL